MATSFGGGGGGMPDFKRLLTNPWILGGVGVVLVIGFVMWKRTSGSSPQNLGTAAGTPISGQLAGTQPGTLNSPDTLGLQLGGIQSQLSNLVAQVSTGQAANPPTVAPTSFSATTEAVPTGWSGPTSGPGAIPVYSDVNDPNSIETWLGFGQTGVKIIGGPVQGRNVPGPGGTSNTTWEEVQIGNITGWVPAQSIGSFQ